MAPGQITVTANVQGTTGQAQITILDSASYSPGTAIWSAPALPGFTMQQVVQAVPTSDGPDLYTTQLSTDGSQSIVQALTADGRQLWQTNAGPLNKNTVPDGNGGVLITEYDTCTPTQTNPLRVVDLDPTTGQRLFEIAAAGVQHGDGIRYCYGNGYDAPQIAVRGDGAVIISGPTNSGFPPLTIVQNNFGSEYPIQVSTSTQNGVVINLNCCMGPPMVNSDGIAYVENENRTIVNGVITSDTLYLIQLSTDNSISSTVLSTTTENEALLPGPIVPDGQGGVLATWTISPSNPPVLEHPYQAVDVVNGVVGIPYDLPFSPKSVTFGDSPTIVLGENGVAFASGHTTSTDGNNTAIDQVVSFNVTSGTPNWNYSSAAGNKLSLVESTAGNGLVAKNSDSSGTETILQFPAGGGSVTFDPVTGSDLDYLGNDIVVGETAGEGLVAQVATQVDPAWTPGTRPKGDAQHNGTTDPGFKLVGVRDCANKSTLFGVTSYTRLPIYELWDINRNKPTDHYTVF